MKKIDYACWFIVSALLLVQIGLSLLHKPIKEIVTYPTNAPPGYSVWCDDEHYFTPILSNQWAYTWNARYKTKEEAIARAWRCIVTTTTNINEPAPGWVRNHQHWNPCE